jgi:hypothetical protein
MTTVQDEQKYRQIKLAGTRFRRELKRRWPTADLLMRQLGMDSNIAGLVHAEKSRSVLDDEGARLAAMHGHADLGDQDMDDGAWDEEGFREALRKHGLDEADIESMFSMLPHRERIAGEDDEETERRLESAENERDSETNFNRPAMAEARRREHRDSEQSRDRMPSRGSNHMPRNRMNMAGDAELDAMLKAIERVPASGGRNPTSAELRADEEAWRASNPKAAMALDSQRREREDKAFFKKFPGLKRQRLAQDSKAEDGLLTDFPEAARIGFSF